MLHAYTHFIISRSDVSLYYRDKGMANVVRQKIAAKEDYLQKLRLSEQTMQSHQTKRSNHKKLTVF